VRSCRRASLVKRLLLSCGVPKTTWGGGVAAVAAIAYAAWLLCGWGGDSVVRVVDDLGLLVFAVFATICSGLAAHSARARQRTAWICLTVGLAGWAIGEAIWCYYQLIAGMKEAPFPSVADIAYLVFPVGAAAALVLFPTGYSTQSRTRLLLDSLIITGALFEISWLIVLEGVYESGGESRFAAGLSMAYPISDIVVVSVALLVLAKARTHQRLTLMLLTAGSVLNALSDSAFVYLTADGAYNGGGFTDVGYVAALLMLALAALVSRRAPYTEEADVSLPSRPAAWLPYMPLVVAVAVSTPRYLPVPGLTAIYVSSTLLMTAVLARQFVVVRQNRRLLEAVADQALHDSMTGLANRALFHDRLTHALQLHQRDDQSVAVLSLDLDDFKLVNDSLGHPAGDALLIQVAERMVGCVRTGDTVARLGGDEFAVLLEGRAQESRLIANRVVQAFDERFVVDGHDLLMRPSVGLASVPADGNISTDDLLKRADTAMYSAKRSQSGGVHTFTSEMHVGDSSDRGADGERLLEQLRQAIDNVDLTLVYQPKFSLRDSEIVGVEALLRWPHPELGMLGPDNFLPLVRRHGLVRSVTELVLGAALDDVAEWRARGIEVPIAVSISAPSLGDLDLPARIAGALTERDLSASVLTVEITEDLLVENVDRTRTVLDRLRERGIRVAIDDFGSGYSALSYLRDLPIDEVKLGRQFITPILVDPRSAAIVRAVIDLAHDLGVTTVAEGVEDAATAERLRDYGCEFVQGYFYSPPVTARAVLDLLRGDTLSSSEGTGGRYGYVMSPPEPNRFIS
jgi:diguanylate cyclase